MCLRILFASYVRQLVLRRLDKRPVCWLAAALVTVVGLSGAAQGDEIAIAPPDNPHNGFVAELVFGWQFSLDQPIQVTALGWFDLDLDGFLNGRHEVGMFRVSDQSLLASALIDSTSALAGDYRYENIPATLLSAGEDYMVAGVDPAGADDRYPVGATLANMNLHPVLNFQHTAIKESTSSLVFPDEGVVVTEPWDVPANFQFTVVPEPSSMVLIVSGLLGVLAIRRVSGGGHAKP